jgi:hypothetical protein
MDEEKKKKYLEWEKICLEISVFFPDIPLKAIAKVVRKTNGNKEHSINEILDIGVETLSKHIIVDSLKEELKNEKGKKGELSKSEKIEKEIEFLSKKKLEMIEKEIETLSKSEVSELEKLEKEIELLAKSEYIKDSKSKYAKKTKTIKIPEKKSDLSGKQKDIFQNFRFVYPNESEENLINVILTHKKKVLKIHDFELEKSIDFLKEIENPKNDKKIENEGIDLKIKELEKELKNMDLKNESNEKIYDLNKNCLENEKKLLINVVDEKEKKDLVEKIKIREIILNELQNFSSKKEKLQLEIISLNLKKI